jgi:hypothetical protein
MVEYLMSLGKTQEEALDWVKTSRSTSPEDSKLSLYKTILTATGNSEEAQAETDKVWDRYRKKSEAPSDGKGPAGSTITYDSQGNAVSGSIGPDATSGASKPAAGSIPAPKDRKIGQKYTNPNGVTATWTKDGWVY